MRTERVFEHRKGFAIFPVADQHATFGEEAVSAALDTGGCSKAATFFKRANAGPTDPVNQRLSGSDLRYCCWIRPNRPQVSNTPDVRLNQWFEPDGPRGTIANLKAKNIPRETRRLVFSVPVPCDLRCVLPIGDRLEKRLSLQARREPAKTIRLNQFVLEPSNGR